MAKAIRFYETGGPEVLKLETVEVGDPGPGQARVRHTGIAVNFIDVYFRTGRYPTALPSGLGSDAVGVVEAVGPGVSFLAVGDRVGYMLGPLGAYSEARVMPAEVLIKLPDGISDRTASTLIMKGLTAQYLFRQVYPLKAGDTILYHAAAGGVGLIACQWAKALGATVIGTTSSEEKAALARAHGADHIIFYNREDVAKRVREITGGEGVAVVYDGVGKDTFMGSLDSLRVRGMMVSFGNASGPVPPFDPLLLSQKGSIFITRPTLMHHTAKREELEELGGELFAMVASGKIRIEVNQTYALADAAQSHIDLEARRTTGSTILLP